MRDENVGPWILGALMALLSLLGLVMASGAEDGLFYGVGLAFFLFGVLFIFGLIQKIRRAIAIQARERLTSECAQPLEASRIDLDQALPCRPG